MMTSTLKARQIDRIAGEEVVPAGTLDDWLCDASTGERIAQQAASSSAQVERALAHAAELDNAGTWRTMPVAERAACLDRIADALDARVEDMAVAEATGSGLPIRVTRMFAGSFSGAFRDAASRIRNGSTVTDLSDGDRRVELLRLPWGPTAIIVPWNAPVGVAAKKIAYALAIGAPVILKATEWGPFGCNLLADAIAEGGMPAGTFQLLHGGAAVGAQIVADPRIKAISFTGGIGAGRSIARAAAENFTAVQLELGGNNPVIVRSDADVELTAAALADGMTKMNGQWCEAPGKVFVPEALHDALAAALVRQLGQVRIGSHLDDEADMGPLSHQAHRDGLDDQVNRLVAAGGTVTLAGTVPDLPGWFWQPRIVTGIPAAASADELFGPVVTLHTYTDEDAAVAEANNEPSGLAGYVFGTDIDAAIDTGARIRFGEVKINGTSLLDMSPGSAQSFWRCVGIGGHGDDDVFRFFCGTQIVGVDRTGVPI